MVGGQTMTVKKEVVRCAATAKLAAQRLAVLTTEVKNRALEAMAAALQEHQGNILFKNEIDVESARETKAPAAMVDRLTLNGERVGQMARGLREVAALADPVGEVLETTTRPNGLKISKVRVPLGVVGIIYEARPNVTADATGLCLKAGNAVVLRGGGEAFNTNQTLAHVLSEAAVSAGVPDGAIQFIGTTSREAISELVKLDRLVDVIIPRGGEEMIRSIAAQSTVPVIVHGKGVCHTYVDKGADLAMAEEICFNAKVQRPGVCNAMETLLVHRDVAGAFLPRMAARYKTAGVEVRGDDAARELVPESVPATEEDWSTEYLDLILSVKVVRDLDEAIAHIMRYGSQHSEAIVTRDAAAARRFLREVDAAAVFWNASTRFTDGGEFGMGAEIGISTQKLHARGPMGVRELTSVKFLIEGNGQVRA